MVTRKVTIWPILALLLLPACVDQETAKFGAVLPFTGAAAIYGESIRSGIEVAYSELQTQKLPFKVALRFEDSRSEPERAAKLLDELYREGALAAIGGVTTGEALAMVSVAEDNQRVLLSPSASAPELSGSSENFFRIFPSDLQEGSKMANFASEVLNLERIVILAKQAPYARGIQGIFEDVFKSYRGEIVEVIEFPANTYDFSGIVQRVIFLKPQGVYLAAHGTELAFLVQELGRQGFQGRVLTTSAFASPTVIRQAGDAANNVLLTEPLFELDSEQEEVRRFVQAYREKFKVDPDLFAAHGYDALMVLAEAADKGGVLPSQFWKGMRAIREFPGATGNIQFDDRGDVQKFPRIYIISDGTLVDYEKMVEARRAELRKRMEELRRKREALMRQGSSS